MAKYDIEVTRDLDTGDAQDFKIECGKDYPNWSWVASDNTAELYKHNKKGSFSLNIGADCASA